MNKEKTRLKSFKEQSSESLSGSPYGGRIMRQASQEVKEATEENLGS